jgi:hypothetical protein
MRDHPMNMQRRKPWHKKNSHKLFPIKFNVSSQFIKEMTSGPDMLNSRINWRQIEVIGIIYKLPVDQNMLYMWADIHSFTLGDELTWLPREWTIVLPVSATFSSKVKYWFMLSYPSTRWIYLGQSYDTHL